MFAPTLVLFALALILLLINIKNGRHKEGLKAGWKQFAGILPILLAAFILAGMLEALIPEEFVKEWLAKEAGMRGVFLGTLGGMLLAMGPYASFPIIASVYGSGAGLGTTISLVTGWTILNLTRLPFEGGILGMRFFLQRTLLGLPFCLIVGTAAHLIDIFFY